MVSLKHNLNKKKKTIIHQTLNLLDFFKYTEMSNGSSGTWHSMVQAHLSRERNTTHTNMG